MCLAVPAEVVDLGDESGVVDMDGVRLSVSFMLLDDVAVGDFVIVHAGFALARLDAEEAERQLVWMREARAAGGPAP